MHMGFIFMKEFVSVTFLCCSCSKVFLAENIDHILTTLINPDEREICRHPLILIFLDATRINNEICDDEQQYYHDIAGNQGGCIPIDIFYIEAQSAKNIEVIQCKHTNKHKDRNQDCKTYQPFSFFVHASTSRIPVFLLEHTYDPLANGVDVITE